MNILYAVQGTGNGHISRARDIIPHLQNFGRVDVLVSGTEAEIKLPIAPTYRLKGLGYVFGKHGGINYANSIKNLRPLSLVKDIVSFPIEKYDLVINDFEPVTAWAGKLKGKQVLAMSHQCSFLSAQTPRPSKRDRFAENVFTMYAPATPAAGFHFERYDDFIHTPVIRKEIRELQPANAGHYTVYLPAYDDRYLVKILSRLKQVQWEVFSKHDIVPYRYYNVIVSPISNEAFIKSLASCEGLLTGAGFESPAEALYLGKKVLAVPMTGQYEQHCNAEGLKRIGVPVVYQINEEFPSHLSRWIETTDKITVNFPDETAEIVKNMVNKYAAFSGTVQEPLLP